jgi:hypothetical protein
VRKTKRGERRLHLRIIRPRSLQCVGERNVLRRSGWCIGLRILRGRRQLNARGGRPGLSVDDSSRRENEADYAHSGKRDGSRV